MHDIIAWIKDEQDLGLITYHAPLPSWAHPLSGYVIGVASVKELACQNLTGCRFLAFLNLDMTPYLCMHVERTICNLSQLPRYDDNDTDQWLQTAESWWVGKWAMKQVMLIMIQMAKVLITGRSCSGVQKRKQWQDQKWRITPCCHDGLGRCSTGKRTAR